MPLAMKRLLWMLLLLAVPGLFAGNALAAAPTITAIRFEGNDTTKPRIMLREMTVQVGDPVDPQTIERSRQAIMDLGLFKTVEARLEDAPEGKVLVITVEEKYYILPLPRADADPNGDYEYGADLKFDNVAGLNQRVQLKYLIHNSVDGVEPQRKEGSLEYGYPRVAGSAYDVNLRLRLRRETVDDPDVYSRHERDTYNAGFHVGRWLDREGPSQGWRGGIGLDLEQQRWKHVRGVDAHEDSQAFALQLSADYVRVHDYSFYREGIAYGWAGEASLVPLGSEHSYNRSLFYARVYNPLGDYRNINWRVRLGVANGERFGGSAYSVGGRELRGYESDYAEGNAFALGNLEYLHPISGYKQLRLAALLDAGNAYPDVEHVDLLDMAVGVGLGARWRVQSFVNIDLTFDWGYGLGSGRQFTYFTTSGTF